MQKKSFAVLSIFILFLLVIIYFFSTANLSKSSFNNQQGLYLVKQAFPQYKVIKTFDTGIHLQAYILEDKKDPTKRTVTFTSEDGDVIVNGELLAWDRNQNKLTSLNQIYANYFTSSPQASDLYLDIKKYATYIQQGCDNAPHKFYAIIDPNCRYCASLFDASQPAIKSGDLAVRWIPIGSLQNSPDVVRSIFNSKDPLQALIEYHNTKKYDESLTKPNEKAENNMLLSSDISGFPIIIYKTPEGALKISCGNKLPLTEAKIAEKDNIKKVNEFLLLTSNSF
ncbi:DsbC family protein [Francisella noatunensis]|uniref:Thiol:disulfide interchange protein n=1 Tax=Francisella noatunensis TaxID=657445 RepID=A0A9Q2KW43_9GAMM|nr:DsbC family protein [Francisella noatunensis]MBK2028955.1 DsbC family protein [Francisella noatunensis]MBK2034540.1 DsbC family protein [Francisella noatunensis]MBK2049149.1 DsbC family protein [Francisella noatunensis]MBK2049861.1 DsbC family protein [Francisella noatunensis]MBK2052032.1 DsbC family protein [Francisella noatunensis]